MAADPKQTPEENTDSLAELADRGRVSLPREFLDFLRHNKKWWLIPILVALLVVGVFVVLVSSSSVAPFIYTLF